MIVNFLSAIFIMMLMMISTFAIAYILFFMVVGIVLALYYMGLLCYILIRKVLNKR